MRQKQEGDRPKEADLRCIITNIPTEDDGKCGQLWRATSAAIYEDLYCRRGSACELKFHELKDESRAQRASATRFLTNFYRLLLSAIAYTIFVAIRLKIFSRFEYNLNFLKTVESTLSQIRRRRARGTSGLWPSSP